MELGIPVEAHHHEVATGGQCEIDMRYQDLVTMADNVMMYKYVCKNVAARHGKVVTFMPKPLFQDNGSGMHVHFSLWKGDKPLFAGNKYAGLSETGPVRDRRDPQACPGAVCPLQPDDQQLQAARPRLRGPGQSRLQQPQSLGRHPHPDVQREAADQAHRVPLPRQSVQSVPRLQRMMMAAIDGIQNKIHPGDPMDKDMYHLTTEEYEKIGSAPGSLEEALRRTGERPRIPPATATSSPPT